MAIAWEGAVGQISILIVHTELGKVTFMQLIPLILFSQIVREFQYIHPTNRKKSTKNPQKNSANREKESSSLCSGIF